MRLLQRPIHPAQMQIIRAPPMLIEAKLAAVEDAPVADIDAVVAVLEGLGVGAPGGVARGGIAFPVDGVGDVVRERVVLVQVVGARQGVREGLPEGILGAVGVGVAVAVGFVEDVGRGGPGGAVFPGEGWKGVKGQEEKGEESGGEHGVAVGFLRGGEIALRGEGRVERICDKIRRNNSTTSTTVVQKKVPQRSFSL